MLASAGAPAVTLGGKQACRRHLTGYEIPGGQDTVDRILTGSRPCKVWYADRRVDSVVDRRAAMTVTLDRQLNQIGASGTEGLVTQPASRWKVRKQQPGVLARCRDQSHRKISPFGLCEVDTDRALAFVERAPK